MQFGRWHIDDETLKTTKDKRRIQATCSCGTVKLVSLSNLKSGASSSCGCKKNAIKVGDVFGNWTAIEYCDGLRFKFRCICGFEAVRTRDLIKSGKSTSCGCARGPKNVLGVKNHFLTAISGNYKKNNRYWVDVLCDCGVSKTILRDTFFLTKSCGCKKGDFLRAAISKRSEKQKEEIRSKTKKTCLRKYGFDSFTKTPEAREKNSNLLLDFSKKGKSRPEDEIKEWIFEQTGINAERIRLCKSGVVREIDIFLPDFNIGIEFNGLVFHHSDNIGKIKGKDKDYHLQKTQMFRDIKGGHLMHIWDTEWNNQKEKVKAFILSKITKGISVRASKCIIKPIPWETASVFCDKYHLQGSPHSSILNLGLFLNDTILSVMTFSKPHRQNMDDRPHLSRYVIVPGYRIHGGLSKMSKYAYDMLATPFVTFVHKRLSDGVSYLKAGYEIEKVLPPDYFYYSRNKKIVVSKQSRKKKTAKTPHGLTEHEHALEDGLLRVYDCGKIKLAYPKKDA